jgi:cytochrome P450
VSSEPSILQRAFKRGLNAAYPPVTEQRGERFTYHRQGHFHFYMTHDYDLASRLLKPPYHEVFTRPAYVKSDVGLFIGYPPERAIIIDQGDQHLADRRIFAKFFNPDAVEKRIAPITLDESDRTIRRWLGPGQSVIDVDPEMRSLTGRIMMRVMFGDGEGRGDGIGDVRAGEIVEAVSAPLESFRKPSQLALVSRIVGWPHNPKPHFNKAVLEAHRTVNRVLGEIIAERRAKGPQSGDILDTLIGSKNLVTGKPFSDEQVKNNLIMFIVAGHETTAAALGFNLWETLKHPEEHAIVQREVDSVSPPGAPLKPSDYKRLPKLTNSARESMRLHPSAYEMGRGADSLDPHVIDVGGEIGAVEFRENVAILIQIDKMHMDPRYFPEPAAFRPSRFEPYGDKSPPGYLPFGDGPHVCMGPNQTMVEMRLIRADQLKRTDMKVIQYPTGEERGMTMRIKDPFRIEVTPRGPR